MAGEEGRAGRRDRRFFGEVHVDVLGLFVLGEVAPSEEQLVDNALGNGGIHKLGKPNRFEPTLGAQIGVLVVGKQARDAVLLVLFCSGKAERSLSEACAAEEGEKAMRGDKAFVRALTD